MLFGATLAAVLCLLLLTLLIAGCAATSQAGAVRTATPAATLTPVPTFPATIQGRFAALMQQTIGAMTVQLQTTYDPGAESVQVLATLGGAVANTPDTISARQEQVKTLCLVAQSALWTSGLPLRTATVSVQGPVLDQYTDLVTQPYGTATLSKARAATFTWNTLTPDAAWGQYDTTWLRIQYNDSD